MLDHYPRPVQVFYDDGVEFMGYTFDHLLCLLGIKDVSTTSKNPLSNDKQTNSSENDNHNEDITTIMTTTNTKEILHLVDDRLSTTMCSM